MPKLLGTDLKKAKRITHSYCGAIVEYFPMEIKETVVKDYSGDSDVYYYIKCPKCKTRIEIKKP